MATRGGDGLSSAAADARRESIPSAVTAARELTRMIVVALLQRPEPRNSVMPVDPTQAQELHRLQDELVQLGEELETAVSRHARLFEQLRRPPEELVIAVKAVADAAANEAFRQTPYEVSRVGKIREQIVKWSIDAYYDASHHSRSQEPSS